MLKSVGISGSDGTQERWFVLDFVGVNPPTSYFPSGGGLTKIGAGWEGDTRVLRLAELTGLRPVNRRLKVR